MSKFAKSGERDQIFFDLQTRFRNWVNTKAPVSLFLPSLCFASCIRLRHFLYDKRILAQKKAGIPVVSIGNLVAGGAGKTQVARMLVGELCKKMNVAILSRGYRSKAEHGEPTLVDPAKHSPEMCGDEPWLLASEFPQATVIVGKDRYKAAGLAQANQAEIIVLDDGMQHRKLGRDYEIVVVDAVDPFGGGYFLPRGMLREDPKRLANADLIVIIGKPMKKLELELSKLSKAPMIEASIEPVSKNLNGISVAIFCGIGNPERFAQTVRSLGANIVSKLYVSDHRKIHMEELNRYANFAKSKGAEVLLCTEKDWVKLDKEEALLPIKSVNVMLKITKNQEAWNKMLTEMMGRSL